MSIKTTAAVLAAGIAIGAVPALASGSADNPGVPQTPTAIPPGYDGSTNPGTQHDPGPTPPDNDATGNRPSSTPPSYDGETNPGTSHRATQQDLPTQAEARALGRTECQTYKTNFKDNKSAFGRCVAAVAKALRSDLTPAKACASARLNRARHDGQARSDYRACVQAAMRALKSA